MDAYEFIVKVAELKVERIHPLDAQTRLYELRREATVLRGQMDAERESAPTGSDETEGDDGGLFGTDEDRSLSDPLPDETEPQPAELPDNIEELVNRWRASLCRLVLADLNDGKVFDDEVREVVAVAAYLQQERAKADALREQVTRMTAERDALRAALEPFARSAGLIPTWLLSSLRVWDGESGHPGNYIHLDADTDDLITAAKALEATTPAPQTDVLRRLWESTADLYRRWNIYPPMMTAQIPVFIEEAAELVHAARHEDDERVTEEAADVIVTALGLVMACHIEYDALLAAIERVIAKNDSKTDETHAIDPQTGKITRRDKLS